MPHREQLERAFGEDLSGVSASVAQGAVLGPMGVRGVALGEKLAFADAAPEMRLVAHEVTHALQKRHAGGMGLGLKTFSEGHVDDEGR